MEIANSTFVKGKGVILRKNVQKDEIVFVLSGRIFNQPTRESIHIGNNKHIYDEYGIYINHSFEPSVRIEGLNVIALKDLHNGDEITFNYNETEINMANTFYVDDVLVSGKTTN